MSSSFFPHVHDHGAAHNGHSGDKAASITAFQAEGSCSLRQGAHSAGCGAWVLQATVKPQLSSGRRSHAALEAWHLTGFRAAARVECAGCRREHRKPDCRRTAPGLVEVPPLSHHSAPQLGLRRIVIKRGCVEGWLERSGRLTTRRVPEYHVQPNVADRCCLLMSDGALPAAPCLGWTWFQ